MENKKTGNTALNEALISLERAATVGLITNNQKEYLDNILAKFSILDAGKKIIVSNLIIGLAEETDAERFQNQYRLLRKYLSSFNLPDIPDIIEDMNEIFISEKKA